MINGKVLAKSDSVPIQYASIYNLRFNTLSDSSGNFSIEIKSDDETIYFSAFGYKLDSVRVSLTDTFVLKFLENTSVIIDTLVIEKQRIGDNLQSPSAVSIPVEQLAKLQVLGESDPLKIAQLTPGVLSGGEAVPGLFVRGSSSDKNLFLLDEMAIYHPFHQFGLYSVINSDVLSEFTIHKGNFPAEYGGKLGSVIDVKSKDGRKDKFGGVLKVGLLMSKIMLESPITKKTSFYFSARGTYGHHLVRPFIDVPFSIYFYDFNWKITSQLSKKTKLNIGGLYSFDKLKLKNFDEEDLGFAFDVNWKNKGGYVKVDHVINDKLLFTSSLSFSDFSLNNYVNQNQRHQVFDLLTPDPNDYDIVKKSFHLNLESKITDIKINTRLNFYASKKHTIKAGVEGVLHKIAPGIQHYEGFDFNYTDSNAIVEKPTEMSVFTEDNWRITKWLIVDLGLRFNVFKNQSQITNLEPRVSTSFIINKNNSVNLGFTVMNQYLFILRSNGIGLPTDLWVSSSTDIPAQRSIQSNISYRGRIKKIESDLTFSTYYKTSSGLVAYSQGASFSSTNSLSSVSETTTNWKNNITVGELIAYGGELMLHKTKGRFNGWLSYALAWNRVKFDELNLGNWYYDGNDRRHVINTVLLYELTKKLSLNAAFTYMSGNPITIASSNFSVFDRGLLEYTNLNNFRIPAYHRMDIGFKYIWMIKKSKASFDFNIYNIYNRKNVYLYYIEDRQLKKISLLPILPTVSFTLTF